MAKIDDARCILATGTTVTSGALSARVAIPKNSGNRVPRVIRVMAVGTGNAYVKIGDSTVTATNNDIYINSNTPEYLVVPYAYDGTPYVAYIEETASSKINITPFED